MQSSAICSKRQIRRGFFDAVASAGDIVKSKRNPEIFIQCALYIGSNPDNCVVIIDSIFGVKDAKTAGMGCIAVLTSLYSSRKLEGTNPELIVDSLKEKTKMLAFIFQ